ncbi:hypothetical protein KVT40_008200 [Elsinoe batatas]|uniref:Uncharacterized protein n=1 Tax=Elsinoe batatas TaxID=2601811 RepID=A0A8K0KSW0_9PEZI|nr:hypothetical protein KVT40_008200 [Elsinoe batatas]
MVPPVVHSGYPASNAACIQRHLSILSYIETYWNIPHSRPVTQFRPSSQSFRCRWSAVSVHHATRQINNEVIPLQTKSTLWTRVYFLVVSVADPAILSETS